MEREGLGRQAVQGRSRATRVLSHLALAPLTKYEVGKMISLHNIYRLQPSRLATERRPSRHKLGRPFY